MRKLNVRHSLDHVPAPEAEVFGGGKESFLVRVNRLESVVAGGGEELSCLPNQLLNSLEPITRAKFPDFVQIQLRIARDQFHDIALIRA